MQRWVGRRWPFAAPSEVRQDGQRGGSEWELRLDIVVAGLACDQPAIWLVVAHLVQQGHVMMGAVSLPDLALLRGDGCYHVG
jgi:hypothetical protein